MGISSYTNFTGLSGVTVHSRGSNELISAGISASGISSANRLKVTVYSGGSFIGNVGSNGVVNIHSNGIATNGYVTNHTVQNVLYGGVAQSCVYGSNNGDNKTISAIPTSTVASSTETITNGLINRVGYIVTTTAVNEITTFKMTDNAKAAGSVIIQNNGLLSAGTLEDDGKVFVEKGGKVSSLIVNGAGRVDVAGGYVNSITESSGYSLAQQSNHGTIVTNSRIIVSATYGIPTSGYKNTSNGVVTMENVWYPASRYEQVASGDMTGGVANIMTVTSQSNRSIASCVLNGTGSDWTDINGTYSLLIADNKNVDSWFMSAKVAEWKNTNISSPVNYLAISYETHDDGYPYWDLNEVTSGYDSTTSALVVSKTLKAFSPAYTDITSAKSTDENTARIPGPEFNILSDGVGNNVNIPSYGHITVNSCGMISGGVVGEYGALTVNKYGIAGIANGSPMVISANGKFTLNIPGSSVKKYLSNGVLIPDYESSKYLSNGVIIDNNVSAIYAPCVYTQRLDSAGTSIGAISISGNASSGVTVINLVAINNDIVYTNSGVTVGTFNISSGGRVLLNSGASGVNGAIHNDGVLNVMNSAYCSCTVSSGGTIKLDPVASGNIIVSAGGNISCTISRMINTVAVNSQAGVLGYTASDIDAGNVTWKTSSGSGFVSFSPNLSSVGSNLHYNFILSGTEYTGTMITRIGTSDASIGSSVLYLDPSSANTPRFGIIDTDDTIEMVMCDSTLQTSSSIGTAVISNHNLTGLSYSSYTIGSGINCNINVTDKVKISSFVTSNPASCTLVASGDVLIDSVTCTSASAMQVYMFGFSVNGIIGNHIPELRNINANNGFVLYPNSYASAYTIPMISQSLTYTPIELACTLTPSLETSLNLIQGSNYQIVSTIYTSTPVSAVGVGIDVRHDNTFAVGANAYVYGMIVESGLPAYITSDGRAIGLYANDNTAINVQQAGKLYQPVAKGSNVTVSAARLATCELTNTEDIGLYRRAIVNSNIQCERKFANLRKAYTAKSDVTSGTYYVYTQMKPIVAGYNLHNTPKYNATEAFWYGEIDSDYSENDFLSAATEGHSAKITMPLMFSNNSSYVTLNYASNTTIGNYWWYDGGTNNYVAITSSAGSWSIKRYTNTTMSAVYDSEVLPSSYRLYYSSATLSTGSYIVQGCTSSVTEYTNANNEKIRCCIVTSNRPIATGAVSLTTGSSATYYDAIYRTPIGVYFGDSPAKTFTMINYTSGYAVRPLTSNYIHYEVQDNTYVSCLLTAENNGIVMDVYRDGKDDENNVASALYHHTDTWVNAANGSTFYDSGAVATNSGKLVVASRTLVGPTILSGGYMEVYGGANISNVTQEKMGIINVAFNRGAFSIEGQCVRTSTALSGRIDEHINVVASVLTGDNNTYMLSMENNLSSGDNRCWKNTFVTTSDIYSISKNMILGIGAYNDSGNNVWKLTVTKDTIYTDPIGAFRSAISSGTGSPENALLKETSWTTGNVKFGDSGVMSYCNTSVCSMVKVTYQNGVVVVPSGVGNASRISSFTSSNPSYSALFVDSANANYLIAASGVFVNALHYDSSINTYVSFDVLDCITSSGDLNVSSSVYLENLGHTRDPWWIHCVDSNGSATSLNTANPDLFTSGNTFSISRVNTVNFSIADRTSDVTVFRITSGATIENVSSGHSAYLTYDNAYIGISGSAVINTLGVIKNSVLKAGRIYFYNNAAMENITAEGGSSIIYMGANTSRCYVNNISLKDNSILMADIHIGHNYGIVTIGSTVNLDGKEYAIPKHVFNMSGKDKLYCSFYAAPYVIYTSNFYKRAYSGGCGMFEDYVHIAFSGYFNTPYLLCKHVGGDFGNNKELQYENFDISSAYCSLRFDQASSGGISGAYWSCGGPYKAVAKGYIASSGEIASFNRNLTALDVVSKAGASFIRSDVGTWSCGGSRHVKAWITPWLSSIRAVANMDYYNTVPVFSDSDFVVSSYVATNSKFNAPSITSVASATVTAGVPNYYLYTNHPETMNISSTIVHVKPGTIIGESGGVSMGLSGALFVDEHAIAMDVNMDANATSVATTVGGTVVSMHRTRFQQVRALHNGIVIAKPNAAFVAATNTEDIAANVNQAVMPAQDHGSGRIVWGKTKGYTTGTQHALGNIKTFTEYTNNKNVSDALYYDVFVYGNVSATNASGTALRQMNVYSTHALYLGPSSVLSCTKLCLCGRGTIIIDKGAKIVTTTSSYYECNNTVVCMDDSIDFNETSNGGMKHDFQSAIAIKYMSGFDITKVPNNYTRITNAASSSYWMPNYIYMYSGYDVPHTGKDTAQVIFYPTGTNVVSGSTYRTYSGIGYNSQIFTVSYAAGIKDPADGTTFDGWVVDGAYEPYAGCDPSEKVSGHLYACKYKLPIGRSWVRILGRYSVPYTESVAIKHVGKDMVIYDCGRTDAAALDYTSLDYPTIIHVNGVVSGTVTGKPILGPAGIIAKDTIITSGKKVTIRDFVDHNNTFSGITCSGNGHIAFGGCSILDNVSSDTVIITTDTTMSNNCIFTMSSGGYKFNVDSVIDDSVVIVDYNFVNSTTAGSNCLIPFIVKKATFSTGDNGGGKLYFTQPISKVTIDHTDAVTMATTYDLDIKNGTKIAIEGKLHKTRVADATVLISGYARNVLASSGAVISLCENGSCDNLRLESGATAFISGYVTGYENAGGVISGDVDSKFIRTENLFTKDYTW